jgi:hypothetical protein
MYATRAIHLVAGILELERWRNEEEDDLTYIDPSLALDTADTQTSHGSSHDGGTAAQRDKQTNSLVLLQEKCYMRRLQAYFHLGYYTECVSGI